jgi:branched-chain amino acid transport system permease protein
MGTWLATVTGVEWFNTIGESVTIVTGLIFIVCVLAFRRGIVGEFLELIKPRGGKPAEAKPAAAAPSGADVAEAVS